MKKEKVPSKNCSEKILILCKKKESFISSLFEVENFLCNSQKSFKIIELYKLLK